MLAKLYIKTLGLAPNGNDAKSILNYKSCKELSGCYYFYITYQYCKKNNFCLNDYLY